MLATSLSAGDVLEVPAGAADAANSYLNAVIIPGARQDSAYFETYFETKGVTDYSLLSLRDPYAVYGMFVQAFYDFAEDTEAEFANGLTLFSWAFPLCYGNEFVRTIDVSPEDKGWKYSGGALKTGNRLIPWLFELRELYPPELGYRISTVSIAETGNFILLHKHEKIIRIATAGWSMRIDGLDPGDRGRGPLVPFDEVIDGLRAAAREHKQWANPSEGRRDSTEEVR
jgi:hypothetical protein